MLSIRNHSKLRLAGKYALLLALSVVFVGPFFWMVSIAVRGSGSIYAFQLIPANPTFQNFVDTWNIFGFGRAFFNSALVAVTTVSLNCFLCSMAAYPLARLEFPGSQVVFFLILSTMMIPFQLYMIPLFWAPAILGCTSCCNCLQRDIRRPLASLILSSITGPFPGLRNRPDRRGGGVFHLVENMFSPDKPRGGAGDFSSLSPLEQLFVALIIIVPENFTPLR
jgi:ABC-type maltose transport system permease subunit